ncbi:MAG: AraC family transcriptional regulator [Cyanosarcina radialis HA8281-LM2]|jgi:AraC-like DNA-binding protein|nr:AraC family transcriptional regulator [Cyanosarcina radialis HA8281-LM2]
MTITIQERSLSELFDAAKVTFVDPSDLSDETCYLPSEIGQGYARSIELRQGLTLEIEKYQLLDRLTIYEKEKPVGLEFHFHLFGHHQDRQITLGNGEYALYGSGLFPKQTVEGMAQEALEICIWVDPAVLRSVMGDRHGELPIGLQDWIRPHDRPFYVRAMTLSPAMQTVLWQIVRCPYQGITKRLYLEGKTLELMSLVMERELAIHRDRSDDSSMPMLPAGTLERIDRARQLLLQNLHQPLSIEALAKQVKLNECTLKQGFRACFGTTPFSYLREYRLEQARKLLEYGEMKVEEIATMVGFASRSHFAIAFKKKFGQNPKDYQQRKF